MIVQTQKSASVRDFRNLNQKKGQQNNVEPVPALMIISNYSLIVVTEIKSHLGRDNSPHFITLQLSLFQLLSFTE